jgi:hypothetical protein
MKRRLMLLALLLLPACLRRPAAESVLLVSLDTTRADFVDTGEGSRAWTPELRRFADSAWVFSEAYSPIPQTLPAHLAVFSGRLPHQLGVYGNEQAYDGRCVLLPQALQRRGWETAAVVSLGTLGRESGFARGFAAFSEPPAEDRRFFLPADRVTDQAIEHLRRLRGRRFFLFAHYSDPHTPYAPPGLEARFTVELDGRPLAEWNAYVGAFLRLRLPLAPGAHRLRLRSETPAGDVDHFVIRRLRVAGGTLAALDHLEYSAAEYEGAHVMRGAEAQAVIRCAGAGELQLFQVIPVLTARAALEYYRREVEFLDRQLGRLLRALDRGPDARRTVVAVFADHGEGLGERERYTGHVRFLNRQFIHVPLIIRFPGERPRRFRQPVGLNAVAPWLLEALGVGDALIPAAPVSLADLRRGRESRLPVLSFTFAPAAVLDRCSVIRWPYQLIVNREPRSVAESREYYDLRLDSSRQLAALDSGVLLRREPGLARRFEESRPLWRAAFARSGGGPSVPAAHLEKLRTLGYLARP